MNYFIYIILFLLITELNAQDLNGIWQGKLTQEPGGCFPEYNIELQIQSDNIEIHGISYDYYDTSRLLN